jgi:16S rRNA (cytosine1402-N4)-methyltransferase
LHAVHAATAEARAFAGRVEARNRRTGRIEHTAIEVRLQAAHALAADDELADRNQRPGCWLEDPLELASAQAIADPRFHIEHTAFSHLRATLQSRGVDSVRGVLMDIGVSSPQIDDPERGFSLRTNGPLDMRMDTSRGETAAEWLARTTIDELTQVIRDYGEERFAASIAKAIVARRAHGRPLSTTADLAADVADAIPVKSRKDALQHPATRTFQAVRIHVNQELEELALALEQAASMLAPGGRLVVISFHSLEDRLVKRFIERRAHPDRAVAAERHLPLRAAELPRPTLAAIARVLPGEEEIAVNPRARSAVLRVAERTAEPWREEAVQ